jgi:hypothetical protein
MGNLGQKKKDHESRRETIWEKEGTKQEVGDKEKVMGR